MTSRYEPSRCILTFHRVTDEPTRDHDVSWPSFLQVLDSIEAEVSTELRLRARSGRSVVLTFDDGTADHAAIGRVLAERNLTGIFFVPAGAIGMPGFLTEAELREFIPAGHLVGSHGFHNVRFDRLTATELAQEVRGSKSRLEEILGAAVDYLAAPGGSTHPVLVKQLEEAGFSAARSVRWGIHRSDQDRWRIPCVPVTELTISRRWVQRAITAWRLPPAMRFVWTAKELLPAGVRANMRNWSHRRSRD